MDRVEDRLLKHFVNAIFIGFACSYVTKCMQLSEKESHEGPFKSGKEIVVFPNQHVQYVALFDRIRRIFGVYEIEGDEWKVNLKRWEYFSCPLCLSFWIALPFSIFYVVYTRKWILWPIIHFNIAATSNAIVRLVDLAS